MERLLELGRGKVPERLVQAATVVPRGPGERRELHIPVTVEAPRAVVERARKHVVKTGRPLLLRDRRRRNYWPLVAIQGDSVRWLVLVDPEAPPAQAAVAGALRRGGGKDEVIERLARLAVTALADVPDRFRCERCEVSWWEVLEGSVCVRGPVALTCLSWGRKDQWVGLYLTMSEVATE